MEINGKRVPNWAIPAGLGGLAGLAILLLRGRSGGITPAYPILPAQDSGTVGPSESTAAIQELGKLFVESQSELTKTMSEQFAAMQQAGQEQQSILLGTLGQQQGALLGAISEQSKQSSTSFAAILQSITSEFRAIQDSLARNTPSDIYPSIPSIPGYPTNSPEMSLPGGEMPTAQQIVQWAQGIGLPLWVGQQFVSEMGKLPSALTELNDWLNNRGWRNPITGALTLPGSTPSGGVAIPSIPNGADVQKWADGIGLPVYVGMAFVSDFGRLPSSLGELNNWLNNKGWRNAATGQLMLP